MGDFFYNSELLTNYLLGKLPAVEQDRLEEEYFCDNEVFTALLNAKDQLINDYLDGKLTGTELQRFEQHFLTLPGRQREVELASFLRPAPKPQIEIAQPAAERRPSLWRSVARFAQSHRPQLALAMAVLIIGSVISWQMMHLSEKSSLVTLTKLSDIPGGRAYVSLSLPQVVSGRASSTQQTIAEAGRETQVIDLNFEVGNEEFKTYRGSLRSRQGRVEILSNNSLKAAKNDIGKTIVNWPIPASQLRVDDYTVTLKGVHQDGSNTRIGDYDFEVRPPQQENSHPSR